MHIFRFLVFILCIGQFSIAQKTEQPVLFDDSEIETQTITEDDLETYRNDDAFNYKEVVAEESFIDKAYRWLNKI